MGKYEKLLDKIITGEAYRNIKFDDVRNLLKRLGFAERSKGSHHIFRKAGIVEGLNLQRDGVHAKPYQIRQIRKLIKKYGLTIPSGMGE